MVKPPPGIIDIYAPDWWCGLNAEQRQKARMDYTAWINTPGAVQKRYRFVKMADVDGNTGQQQPIVFRWNKDRQAFSPVMNPSKPNLYLISPYKLTRDFDVSYEDRDKVIATRPPDRGAGTAEKQKWGVGLGIKRGGRDISLKTEYSKKPK
jgi:hypothetical protein